VTGARGLLSLERQLQFLRHSHELLSSNISLRDFASMWAAADAPSAIHTYLVGLRCLVDLSRRFNCQSLLQYSSFLTLRLRNGATVLPQFPTDCLPGCLVLQIKIKTHQNKQIKNKQIKITHVGRTPGMSQCVYLQMRALSQLKWIGNAGEISRLNVPGNKGRIY
jgi:hypothetical protein